VVLEIDPGVLDLARTAFGLRSSAHLRLRVADAREGLADVRPQSQDVVVRDAFSGATVPTHLTTRQFLAQVRRVLVPGGVYVANLADAPPLGLARGEAATALAAFGQVALVAEPAQLTGRRYGNVVLAASGAVRARLLDTAEVRAFASGHRPWEDPPDRFPVDERPVRP
jgi:spermidine synthase